MVGTDSVAAKLQCHTAESGLTMKDLTEGSIPKLLVAMAVPIAIGMIFQTLYCLARTSTMMPLTAKVAVADTSAPSPLNAINRPAVMQPRDIPKT